MLRGSSPIVDPTSRCAPRHVLMAFTAVHLVLALGATAGCAPASLVPALTLGATAVVREHATNVADPLVVRAGAWMTWRMKATPARGEATAPTAVAADASDTYADRATPEPACALAAACTWAATARQDALGRFDARDAFGAQEVTP